MANNRDLKTEFWQVLISLPKPVTRTHVLFAAEEFLPGRENAEFIKWFDKMGDAILQRLNHGD